jgi:hypothetical protein
MRLTMKEKQKATVVVAARYQKARKRDKGKILDEFIELTSYTRCYAAYVLRTQGEKIKVSRSRTFIMDVRTKVARKRGRVYDEPVREALRKIWYIMDCICGKRLAPILGEVLWKLERYKEISLDAASRGRLLRISAATIDRLLAPERRKQTIKGKGNTKPGTLLKHQIPIRTFAEWNDKRPGFVEIDLVGHDGGDSRGDFIQTLDVTDVCTGWTETQAVRNKAQVWVFEALQGIAKQLPFELRGIDSDNGGEFINNHLLRFCAETRITFTRSRSYRKNDNCFVEQKNYSVVRRAVGYLRYDTEEEQRVLNELYGHLRLYTNFFQPVMKLLKKTRIGSRVKKTYDTAQTPHRRVLASPAVAEENKKRLKRLYAGLNPAALKRHITRLQNKLIHLASLKETLRKQKQVTQQPYARGYDGMDRAVKNVCGASYEVATLTNPSPPSARRSKKVKTG